MSAWTGRTFPGARFLRAPLVLCVLIVAGVPGCMHWARSDTTTAQLVETKHPDQVRITRVDGRTTVLTAPRIAGDSIVGTAMAPDGVWIPDYAIPLADVRDVAVRRLNVGATLGLAAGAGVTAALIAAAASRPSSPPPIVGGGGGGCGDGCYSCPLVYSWDGAHWRLDSGTFGGAIVRALERTDVDNLDYATARNGVVRLDVRNELNETDFVDRMAVVAVDHDSGVDVAPTPRGTCTLSLICSSRAARPISRAPMSCRGSAVPMDGGGSRCPATATPRTRPTCAMGSCWSSRGTPDRRQRALSWTRIAHLGPPICWASLFVRMAPASRRGTTRSMRARTRRGPWA